MLGRPCSRPPREDIRPATTNENVPHMKQKQKLYSLWLPVCSSLGGMKFAKRPWSNLDCIFQEQFINYVITYDPVRKRASCSQFSVCFGDKHQLCRHWPCKVETISRKKFPGVHCVGWVSIGLRDIHGQGWTSHKFYIQDDQSKWPMLIPDPHCLETFLRCPLALRTCYHNRTDIQYKFIGFHPNNRKELFTMAGANSEPWWAYSGPPPGRTKGLGAPTWKVPVTLSFLLSLHWSFLLVHWPNSQEVVRGLRVIWPKILMNMNFIIYTKDRIYQVYWRYECRTAFNHLWNWPTQHPGGTPCTKQRMKHGARH